MPSLVPGFECDIFISYRHNDNLDGWVTDFVQVLEKELKGTLKDPVEIYFDRHPHDTLLETYNVDKSLERKLKCLVFIPIISQTYCDPKSFAWRQEFLAFNKSAAEEPLGRDIPLSNGNVSSRILPIKIHELDKEDTVLIEKETGGPLRAIAFIYKEPGVNRPLKSSDGKTDNQNKTDYKNQINKVANAIKEILTAIKQADQLPVKPTAVIDQPKRTSPFAKKSLVALVILCIIGLGYFIFSANSEKLTASTADELVVDRSIAVLPFVNMSSDPEQEYFSDGISEEILNLLAKVPELKVIGRTSSFYFKGKNEDLRVIGEKLGAAYILEGSLRKDGNNIRITAQLIRATDGIHLWSETFERKMESIFRLQDEIASIVLAQLKLKLLGTPTQKSIANQEVYNLILKGRYFFNNGNYYKALEFYEQALAKDSSQVIVWTSLAQARVTIANSDFRQFKENSMLARRYAEKALSIDENNSDAHRALGMVYLFWDFDWEKARREFNMALALDPNNSDAYRNLSQLERAVGNLEAAVTASQKSVDLNPFSIINISNLAGSYAYQSDFTKSEEILTEVFETNSSLKRQLSLLYTVSGKVEQAQKLFEEAYVDANADDREITRAIITYAAGNKSVALENLRKNLLHYDGSRLRIAEAFAFMEQKDEAFYWLSKAYDEKYRIFSVEGNLLLRNLHGDPRYEALLRKMNLPIESK